MIRRRPVTFGNPALGTFSGAVHTQEGSSSGSVDHLPKAATTPVQHCVALVQVPPAQVPEGILNVLRPHIRLIRHVRIFRSSPNPTKEEENATFAEEQEQPLENGSDDETSSSSSSYVILVELSTVEAASKVCRDLHAQPYTSLDETEVCLCFPVVAVEAGQQQDGSSLLQPFLEPPTRNNNNKVSAPTERTHIRSNTTNTPPPQSQPEVNNCAVCLERMDLSECSILTTVCNHSFHLDCLLQWQDSPCPVCRYDHSGLNESLSQCHVCGTTEDCYVCLVCGVVSCGGSSSSAAAAVSSSTASQIRSDHAAASRPDQRPSTPPPVHHEEEPLQQLQQPPPPLPRQEEQPQSHARQHYDESLHAYALDTETQHVWDFCGQGYVHRLLQNAKDGKLVEVHDPHSTSQERSLSPGLSDAQETQVVHRKLEGFARQYYSLLQSQLEQQRLYYEERLEDTRNELRGSARTADLISALKQERNQLAQRCVSLQRRHEKVSREVSFLKSMNESLVANKEPLKREIKQAQRERAEAREMVDRCLPQLEEKVRRLMMQLEGSPENDAKPAARP